MTTSKCFNCENGEIKKTGKKVNLMMELGFTIPVDLYECNTCHTQYVLCSNCDGEGFVESFDSHFDCEECHGQGLVRYYAEENSK